MIGYPFITFIYPLEFKAKKAFCKNLYSLHSRLKPFLRPPPPPSPPLLPLYNKKITFLYFTTLNSLRLKNTILESSSKRRLPCLKQGTTYVTGWIGRCNLLYRHSLQSPPPLPVNPLWKAILCSYYCRHHWRLYPGGPKCRRLKKRQSPPFIVY